MLARLGADVVKVEHPVHGESARASTPAMLDPARPPGRRDLPAQQLQQAQRRHRPRRPRRDRELFLRPRRELRRHRRELQARHDGATRPRLRRHQCERIRARSTSRSRDSATRSRRRTATGPRTRRSSRRCRGSTTTATRPGPPVTIPVGALGDISSALYGVIGVLAALRHRDRTGEGQYVDIAMYDAMVAMTDIVTNFWSLGVHPEPGKGKTLEVICEGFERERRLRRRPDRPRAPVRTTRRPHRASRVEGRPDARVTRTGGRRSSKTRSGPPSTRGRRSAPSSRRRPS